MEQLPEKAVNKAFEFIDKIIIPTIKEVGWILADNVRFWMYKNQINIILKAQKYYQRKGITLRTIPGKTLATFIIISRSM